MKKSGIFLAVIVVMLASIAFSVNATLTSDIFDKTKPTFGSRTQIASNPKDDDISKRDIFVTRTITFKNSDIADVDATMQVDAVSPFSQTSDLKIENKAGLIFKANSDTLIEFKARIPEKLDAIDENGNEVAFKVATLTFTEKTNISNKVIVDVFMQRENNLEISDLDATINSREKKSLGDDDTLENLKPGDRIEIEVEASNNYDKDSNLDMEDVTLEIDCSDEDNFDFDDKTEDLGDLAPEDEDTQTLNFDVENDAEDKDSSCIILLDGRDQNGARHGEAVDFDIEVTRKSHDIQITSAAAQPDSLTCTDREITLTVDLLNLGRSDEDRVALEVTSKAISFQERVSNIEMNEDDSEQEIFVVPVNPTVLKPGAFAIQVQSFYDNTKSSDTETVQVDNLCTAGSTGGNGNGAPKVPIIEGALELESETLKVNMGSSTSIPVKVTNLERVPVEYLVALADTAEFAESSTSKSVFLNPGQQSTVLLNLKSKSKIDTGKYSGIIVLKDSAGKTLETKTFTVDIEGKAAGTGFDLGSIFEGSDSRVFWIIGDIILIIVAIFFIRLIFTGGKRKQQAKKMADYEAEMARRKPKRK